jgi:signal transduction histidine kinase
LATQPIGEAFLTYRDSGTYRISQVIHKYADLDSNVTNFSITDTSGQIQYIQNEAVVEGVAIEEATAFIPHYNYNSSGNIQRVIVPYFEDSGVHRYSVVYDISDAIIVESISRQVSLIVIFTIISMLISILVMYGVVDYNFIHPIKNLSEQALAISAGNIEMQIISFRHDEVADLSTAVNKMAGSLRADIKKLEELDELKSEFLTIVSHNLRTPLTIIRGYLDNADQVKSIEEMKPILEKLDYGSNQLSVFAEDMITIAEIESGQPIGNRKEVVVPDFIKVITQEYDNQMGQQKIEFKEIIEPGNYKINVNQSLMRGVVWSVLDNAQKFTKPGGLITLTVSKNEKSVLISVKDDGAGISEEEIPKLFTKFHRGTSVITYDYEGTGIGLYSSMLVVREHGGKIAVESKLGKGSKFTITIPRSS